MSRFQRRKVALLSIIVAIIVVVILIISELPFYSDQLGDNTQIEVDRGYANVTYTGDFKNIYSDHAFLFSTNLSHAEVSDSGHPNSTLDVSLDGGAIYFETSGNSVLIEYNLSVHGQFTSNLHPDSLTLSYTAKGLSNQSAFNVGTWAPPYSDWIPSAQNLSPDTLGYLAHAGFGSVSVTTKLLNENSHSALYNFSVSIFMNIFLGWYQNSTHTFDLSAQVNGLSKPVNSTISMSIVEVNS